MDFCSNCVWAKEVEMKDGIYIVCQRMKNPDPGRVNAIYWQSTRNVFRKLNAGACTKFKKKDVTGNR